MDEHLYKDDKEKEIYNYGYDEYQNDLHDIVNQLEGMKPLHLVGVMRGGLPLMVHLSNMLHVKCSIVEYQTRDGDTKEPIWYNRPKDLPKDVNIVILDEIFDSGKTMKDVYFLVNDFYRNNNIYMQTLFGKKDNFKVQYLHEQDNRWIIFPWERI